MRYSPLSSVVAFRASDVSICVAVISTRGSTPPEVSRTTPKRVPVVVCAWIERTHAKSRAMRMRIG